MVISTRGNVGSKLGKKAFVIMVAATVVFSSLIGVIAQVQGSVSPTQAVDGDETSLYNPTCYIDFTDDGFASYGYHDYDFKEEHTFWDGARSPYGSSKGYKAFSNAAHAKMSALYNNPNGDIEYDAGQLNYFYFSEKSNNIFNGVYAESDFLAAEVPDMTDASCIASVYDGSLLATNASLNYGAGYPVGVGQAPNGALRFGKGATRRKDDTFTIVLKDFLHITKIEAAFGVAFKADQTLRNYDKNLVSTAEDGTISVSGSSAAFYDIGEYIEHGNGLAVSNASLDTSAEGSLSVSGVTLSSPASANVTSRTEGGDLLSFTSDKHAYDATWIPDSYTNSITLGPDIIDRTNLNSNYDCRILIYGIKLTIATSTTVDPLLSFEDDGLDTKTPSNENSTIKTSYNGYHDYKIDDSATFTNDDGTTYTGKSSVLMNLLNSGSNGGTDSFLTAASPANSTNTYFESDYQFDSAGEPTTGAGATSCVLSGGSFGTGSAPDGSLRLGTATVGSGLTITVAKPLSGVSVKIGKYVRPSGDSTYDAGIYVKSSSGEIATTTEMHYTSADNVSTYMVSANDFDNDYATFTFPTATSSFTIMSSSVTSSSKRILVREIKCHLQSSDLTNAIKFIQQLEGYPTCSQYEAAYTALSTLYGTLSRMSYPIYPSIQSPTTRNRISSMGPTRITQSRTRKSS